MHTYFVPINIHSTECSGILTNIVACCLHVSSVAFGYSLKHQTFRFILLTVILKCKMKCNNELAKILTLNYPKQEEKRQYIARTKRQLRSVTRLSQRSLHQAVHVSLRHCRGSIIIFTPSYRSLTVPRHDTGFRAQRWWRWRWPHSKSKPTVYMQLRTASASLRTDSRCFFDSGT